MAVLRYALVSLFVVACGDDAASSGGSGGAGAKETTSSESTGGASTSSSPTTSTSTSTGTGASGGSGGTGGSVPLTCAGKSAPAMASMELTMPFGGVERAYMVHVPPSYDPSIANPVVLMLHGYTETKGQFETISQMTPAADAKGYIVVYAQGLSTSWNAGRCCGSSQTLGVDDVGFVRAMIDEVSEAYCVDPKRVFSAGFSNGAMLSHRLACEASDKIAAIGPVSGTMAFDGCAPARPVPIMHFHGTSDFVVPYNGGGFANGDSVSDTIADWVTRNGCGGTPTITFDMGKAECVTYGGCQANADVSLCTLTDGGHQWPGGMSAGPAGEINMDISASSAMLDFFAQHPMP